MNVRPGRFRDWPIRRKLLAMVLLPLWVVLPALGLLLLLWGNGAVDRLLVAKVRADLAVAHGYFQRRLTEVGASASAMADSNALQQALAGNDPAKLQALLLRLRQREQLDFVQWRDAQGQPKLSDAGPPIGDLPHQASGDGRARATIEAIGLDRLPGLTPTLREQVPVTVLPTRNASPSDRQHEQRAMLALASAPVRDSAGRLLGTLQAGVLLNRNLAFIDQLNDIVYPAGSLPWGSRGTATLFLDDVRISTNVRLFNGPGGASPDAVASSPHADRALGTRVSSEVRAAVLDRGETWLDRAFVVNDWYVSGYEALSDHSGARIGMLYVGFLERPFVLVKYAALASIGLIFFSVMIGAGWVSLRWARSIFKPLEQMSRTMQQVEAGAGKARVGQVASRDEIGELAAHFDHLLDTLDDKTQALQQANAELDAKVAERSRALEAAQQHLVRAEKMAAVGQLTASIAHEINNPIAVIQGNVDLLRELLGPGAETVRTELTLVDQQIERMRLIVTQLLQFARPTEYAAYVEAVAPAVAIDDCLVLVAHMLAQSGIVVQRSDRATRRAGINRQELQQVLVNLLVNAAQAMPHGGTLELRCADWDSRGVAITVADNGPGLPDDLLGQLFQPFVTGKAEGTGLGLWISRSLVERYGGDILAANRPTGGAEFTVLLLSEPSPAPAPGLASALSGSAAAACLPTG